MTQRNNYRSPWARKWYVRREGERHRDYEDRIVSYVAGGFAVFMALILILLTYAQFSNHRDPDVRDMRGAAKYQGR